MMLYDYVGSEKDFEPELRSMPQGHPGQKVCPILHL